MNSANHLVSIMNIGNQLYSSLSQLTRQSFLMQTDQALLQLYYSLIYPLLTYSLITWGNTHQTTLLPIIIL